ncbi:MAG TPA: hypothetical protein VGL93_04930 [Streptosporangiaceae bacterium]
MANEDPPSDLDLVVVLNQPHTPVRKSGPQPSAPHAPYVPSPAPPTAADPPPARTERRAPEDIAPEWWTAMSRTDGVDEPERIGRIPRPALPPDGTADAAHRRPLGMLALASLLGVLVFAGVLTHFLS